MQRPEGGGVAVPEAPPRAPHVPVGEVVDEGGDGVAGARGVEGLQPLADLGRPWRAGARSPSGRGRSSGSPALAHVVDVRVQHVEAVRVPQLQQELAHGLADGVGGEQVAVPRLLGGEEVPAEGVGAVAVDHLPRDDDVAQRLRHLLALRVGDVAEAEHGAVRRARRTAASRRRAGSRTSRASGRSPRRCSRRGRRRSNCSWFSNGAWHCANGIAPESNHTSMTSGTRRISSPHSAHGHACSSTNGRCGSGSARPERSSTLGEGAQALDVAVRAAPHRQRRAPVALARDRPVDVVLQPAAEAPVLDVRRGASRPSRWRRAGGRACADVRMYQDGLA